MTLGPQARIAELRERLLAGRGPGASEKEIADNTRNRLLLTARPATPEEARRRAAGGHGWASALFGAAVALLTHAVVGRALGSRNPVRDPSAGRRHP
jgi:hypothetical protein